MAQLEEASPICRGKNLSWETVLLFYNNMPREAMPKAQFHAYTEARINGWTTTHSQIARQLAFYYEEDGVCYPRFTKEMSYAALFKYMQNWAAKYFVPNPYAPSLKEYTPTCIYSAILKGIDSGESHFDTILDSIFGISLSSHDKVRVYLSNFTDLIIDDSKQVSINNRTFGVEATLHPDEIFATDPKKYFDYFTIESKVVAQPNRKVNKHLPLQQIFYGAPGTGKSHGIKAMTDGGKVIRTTFHPDSDYSTFVGAYKPTAKEVVLRDLAGHPIEEDGHVLTEEKIVYEFVEQAFLQAYVCAWKNQDEPIFLIIEEINRGNCAQIFGDLFQLLDRGENGFSVYPINADKDMQKQLKKSFKDIPILDVPSIGGMDGNAIAEKIRNGEILLLPSNLYIWATMNTSDQSLFPIDSAFKRRWDWKYVPISDAKKGWQIEANGMCYDWWQFLQKINDKIEAATYSEDKKLGYFFCKAKDGIIDAETFVGKVLFYIWNDVFKDSEEAGDLFMDEDGSPLSYHKFYTVDGDGNAKIAEDKVVLLLKNLGLMPVGESDVEENEEEEDDDGNTLSSGKRNYDKFSVNGKGRYGKNLLASECMKEYISLNPEMPVNEVYANWKKLGNIVPHFVETKEEYEARTDKKKLTEKISCGDSVIYVEKNGYGNNGAVEALISAVNKQDWGIKLARIEE